jgi:hypothetical protein
MAAILCRVRPSARALALLRRLASNGSIAASPSATALAGSASPRPRGGSVASNHQRLSAQQSATNAPAAPHRTAAARSTRNSNQPRHSNATVPGALSSANGASCVSANSEVRNVISPQAESVSSPSTDNPSAIGSSTYHCISDAMSAFILSASFNTLSVLFSLVSFSRRCFESCSFQTSIGIVLVTTARVCVWRRQPVARQHVARAQSRARRRRCESESLSGTSQNDEGHFLATRTRVGILNIVNNPHRQENLFWE